jgi:hypothetical protein
LIETAKDGVIPEENVQILLFSALAIAAGVYAVSFANPSVNGTDSCPVKVIAPGAPATNGIADPPIVEDAETLQNVEVTPGGFVAVGKNVSVIFETGVIGTIETAVPPLITVVKEILHKTIDTPIGARTRVFDIGTVNTTVVRLPPLVH